MTMHYFDVSVAENVGVNAAIVYQNVRFICEHNRTNEKHIHDGKSWMFDAVKAIASRHKYLSEKQIRAALKRLIEAGYIEEGNHNKSSYDRTKWYSDLHAMGENTSLEKQPAVSDKRETSSFPNGQMEQTKRANGTDQNGQLYKEDKINKINNISIAENPLTDIEADFRIIWDSWPNRKTTSRKKAFGAYTRLSKADRDSCFYAAIEYSSEQTQKIEQDPGQVRFCLHLATFINQRRFETMEESENEQAINP